MTDVIEGTAIEVIPPERAIVPAQPGQALVAAETPTGPAEMIAKATALADALSAMVSKQKLYTEIRGKKYPHVEAWQTIGRMDNVVARESQPPIRHEDGSYEAFVELIRLSDGMVIGAASALCGTKDDTNGRQDWSKASEPSRRSMAATRATSRAFRGQYAWIMALAGYQPTPADEMPDDDRDRQPTNADPSGIVGEAVAQGTQDFELRESPDGWTLPFRVKQGGKSWIVIARDDLAQVLSTIRERVLGQNVTVWGHFEPQSFPKAGKTVTYEVLVLERIKTPDGTLPAPVVALTSPGEPVEAETAPLFDAADMASLDRELAS